MRYWGTLLAAVMFQGTANAAPPVPLAPTGPWNIDYGERECRLLRTFGSGNSAVTLRLARSASPTTYDMLIASPSFPRATRLLDAKLSASPAEASMEIPAWPFETADKTLKIFRWYNLEQQFVEKLDDNQIITIRVGQNAVNIALEAKGLKKALAALQTCHDDLLTNVFKYDPATYKYLNEQATPLNDAARWVTTDDYPRDALNRRQEGVTALVVQINSAGTPTKCETVESSGFELLDRQACLKIMERAKFTPAKDKDGKPAASIWVRKVHWMIPK